MPASPLLFSELEDYKKSLSEPGVFRKEHFKQLKELYSSFFVNQQLLSELEYQIDLERTSQDYLSEKRDCESNFDGLNQQFKQLENRIIAMEQKLIRGIPDDLELIDKLIAEQESIIEEQEKINSAELELTERISRIDIAHGKALEKLEQLKNSGLKPLQSRFEFYQQDILKAERTSRLKVRLSYLIPLIVIPVLLDYAANAAGFVPSGLYNKSHGVLGHYVFFITTILFQVFAGEKALILFSAYFSGKYLKASLENLENMLKENMENISSLKGQNDFLAGERLSEN